MLSARCCKTGLLLFVVLLQTVPPGVVSQIAAAGSDDAGVIVIEGQEDTTEHHDYDGHRSLAEEKEEDEEPGEEEEEEEEEEWEPKLYDVGIAVMLLGSVSFVMMLFYLVNWADDDVRRYSWGTISTTISIFVAVLLFSGLNSILLIFTSGLSENVLAGVFYLHLTFWLCTLQFSVAFLSGAAFEYTPINLEEVCWVYADAMRADYGERIPEDHLKKVRSPDAKKSVVDVVAARTGKVSEVPCERRTMELDKRKRRMKCWATLIAHISGFSSIFAGATMQQVAPFNSNPITVFLAAVLNLAYILAIFQLTGKVRKKIEEDAKAVGGKGTRAKLFHEEVSEAEDDICALSFSFLIVQALRLALSGVLPNNEGLEEPELPHSPLCALGLILCGIAFAFSTILVINAKNSFKFEEESFAARFAEIMTATCGMCLAWCIMWATRWLLVMTPILVKIHCQFPDLMARVLMSIILSALVCGTILLLDKLDDTLKALGQGGSAKKMIQVIINALGILAGFTWEHAFDGAVFAVASTSNHPVLLKIVLAAAVGCIIIPAWRRYILVKAMQLNALAEPEPEEEEVGGESGPGYKSLTQEPGGKS